MMLHAKKALRTLAVFLVSIAALSLLVFVGARKR